MILLGVVMTLGGAHGCASSRTAQIDEPKPADPLAEFAWLTGSWSSVRQTPHGEVVSEEHWTAPAGGTMFAVNRTIRDGRTVEFECLRIEFTPKGPAYLASPGGRHPPTAFPIAELTANRAVFENPEHDFPQRIVYELVDPGTLRARVEGTQNGHPAAIDFLWKRNVSALTGRWTRPEQ